MTISNENKLDVESKPLTVSDLETTKMDNFFSLATIRHFLYCEFDHYDYCLKGLMQIDGRFVVCRVAGEIECVVDGNLPFFTLHLLDWDEKCQEYLGDYRHRFLHWFYDKNRNRMQANKDQSLGPLSEKWKNNPILDKAGEAITVDEFWDTFGDFLHYESGLE